MADSDSSGIFDKVCIIETEKTLSEVAHYEQTVKVAFHYYFIPLGFNII